MKIIYLSILILVNSLFAQTNKLGCENIIDFKDYRGMTYLSFMQDIVKPQMDRFAIEGYSIADEQQVIHTLKNVSYKVNKAAISAARGFDNLMSIVGQLKGKIANLYTLPNLIANVDRKANKYKLATFLGLASCGGAIIKYDDLHYAYNIHYGTGDRPKDERTGRSFGEGIVRAADDASDKNYLKDLEEFGKEHSIHQEKFYQALISSLSNSDNSLMNEVSNFGKLVLTDFLAVFTAEQARNLMDDRIHTHWDAALLEVTLLNAFHSGQDKFKLFYTDPELKKMIFTSEVYNQQTGCSERLGRKRSARMYDYWQFSKSTNPEHCKRSGINITRKEFRKLGKMITSYLKENNPTLINDITILIEASSRTTNIFYQLSKFFINSNTDKNLIISEELSQAFSTLLMQIHSDANKITKYIEEKL
jgi:hypothetical protein